MRKLVLLFVVIAMLASVSLFAQDEVSKSENVVSRKVGFYLSSNSGDVVPPLDYGIFGENHEHELALFYSQNFAKAQWITFTFSGILVYKQFKEYNDDGSIAGQDDISVIHTGSPRAKMALSLNGSGFGANGLTIVTSIDTRTKFDLGFYYGLKAGIGYLSTGVYSETYLIPRLDYSHEEPVYIETLSAEIKYSLTINSVFGFDTSVYARFCDILNEDMDKFEARWDWNLKANINGLGMRVGTRLDIEEIFSDKDIDVDLSFRAGVEYVFSWTS